MQNLPISFTSFRDVAAALAEPALSLDGASLPRDPLASSIARESLPPSEIAQLEPAMRASARATAHALSVEGTVDLIASFAAPWSRELALAYALIGREARAHVESERLIELARQVFNDAAHATSRRAATASSRTLLELAQVIGSDRSPLVVQGFVALANTLPLLLAGAWHALVMQPGAWQALRRSPTVRTAAIDELVRLASPARVVFRQAVADVTIGMTRVASGDEVFVALHDANRCPEHFTDAERFVADRFAPDRADPDRVGTDRATTERTSTDRATERVTSCRHVGLGRSPHACAGGALVRMALDIATAALLDEFDQVTLAGPVTWLGGFAIDGITSLPVTLQRPRARAAGEGACPA